MRQNPFYNDVITGISNTCNQFNYATNTTVSNNEKDLLKEVQYFIDSKKVDGFILLYSKENDPIFQLLVNLGIPFVVIGKIIIKMMSSILIMIILKQHIN